VFAGEHYQDETHALLPGDDLVLYTDGITEAHNSAGEMFGLARLDAVLEDCSADAEEILRSVLHALAGFTAGRQADDDRTLLVAKVS
jgi:sigma-B regulation protein RsbU (phosphoserine phosphatase)